MSDLHLANKPQEAKTVECMVCHAKMTVPIPSKFELLNGPSCTVAVFHHEPFACECCQSVYTFTVPEGTLKSLVDLFLLAAAEPMVQMTN